MELILPDHAKRKEFKPSVVVKMDKKVDTFEEFVVVGYNRKNNQFTMVHNADPLTLAVSLELVKNTMVQTYEAMGPEEKEAFDEFLGGMHEKNSG